MWLLVCDLVAPERSPSALIVMGFFCMDDGVARWFLAMLGGSWYNRFQDHHVGTSRNTSFET